MRCTYQIYQYVHTINKRANDCSFEVTLESQELDIPLRKTSNAKSVQTIHLSIDYEPGKKVCSHRDVEDLQEQGRGTVFAFNTTAEKCRRFVHLAG